MSKLNLFTLADGLSENTSAADTISVILHEEVY